MEKNLFAYFTLAKKHFFFYISHISNFTALCCIADWTGSQKEQLTGQPLFDFEVDLDFRLHLDTQKPMT